MKTPVCPVNPKKAARISSGTKNGSILTAILAPQVVNRNEILLKSESIFYFIISLSIA